MRQPKSNPGERLRSFLMVIVAAALLSGPVAAQTPVSPQPGMGGGQDTGSQQGSGGLTPEQAFEGGVERGGAVGESSSGPVGASATSAAGESARGTGARSGGLLGGGLGGGGLGAAFGNLLNNNADRRSTSTPPIRTRLRSAVALPDGMVPSQPMRQYTAEKRLRNVSRLQPRPAPAFRVDPSSAGWTPANPYGDVDVQIDGRTATLRGSVTNESERRMSELLMRLEPGVSGVQNRIRVAPEVPTRH